jgi:hypothetical protein
MQKTPLASVQSVSRNNADHIGKNARSLVAPVASPVQMTGEKSKSSMSKEYAGKGAAIGTAFAPVLSGGFHAVTGQEQGGWRENGLIAAGGALVGGLIGGIYGYTQGYDTFKNKQKVNYADELESYQNWKGKQKKGLSAYESGNFFEYNSTNDDIIHQMLNTGSVMYTYDTDERLRVSGKHGSIKHALLAGGRDVYSAGNASLELTGHKKDIASAIEWVKSLAQDRYKLNFYGDDRESEEYKEAQQKVEESSRKIESLGFTPEITLEELSEQLLSNSIEKNQSTLTVNNDSGHYSPGYSAGHMALKAWSDAGYKHVKWESVKAAKKGFFNAKVNDIDNR